jgi:hypothetical protein
MSLRPILKREKTPWRDAVFSEVIDLKVIRDFHWKLIFYPGRPYGGIVLYCHRSAGAQQPL